LDAGALPRGVSESWFRAEGFGASLVLCRARDDLPSLSRCAFSLVKDRPAVLYYRAAARRDSPTPCTRTAFSSFPSRRAPRAAHATGNAPPRHNAVPELPLGLLRVLLCMLQFAEAV